MITSGVIITALICGTVLILFWSSSRTEHGGYGQTGHIGDRLGRYLRFLKAVSEIRSNPDSRKGWDQFTTALHEITLTAEPDIVVLVQEIAKELHGVSGAAKEVTIQKLITKMRNNLGSKSENFDESVTTIYPFRSERSSCGNR